VLETLEKAFKELQKQLEKVDIMALAIEKMLESEQNQKQVKKKGKSELENTKTTLDNASEGLDYSVKGQFGKKITEVFEKQDKLLDSF
jgi:Skp family chaperone for outer membrane proteins